MSLCFRTISSRLPPFVGTRKQFDRQLPKHIKSSTFLEEFFGIRNVLNPILTLRQSSESNKNFPVFLLFQNQSISSLDNPSISLKKNDQKEYRISKFKDFKELQRFLMPLSVINSMDSSLEARHNKQKAFNMKQYSKYVEEMHLLSSPFTINDQALNQMIPPVIENKTVLLITGEQNIQAGNKNEVEQSDKASREQLEYIYNNLRKELPHLFVKVMDYTVYREDIEFVNNIRGVTTKGIFGYVKQVALLRTIAHLKFAYVKFDILKITMHPEDSTVKVRWRIRGVPGFRVFITFWKFKIWKMQDSLDKGQETWYDGFSTFYVDNQGKIYKHVADKMMPDHDSVIPKEKAEIAAKLALFLGIEDIRHVFPDPSSAISNLGNFFFQSEKGKCLEKAMLKMK